MAASSQVRLRARRALLIHGGALGDFIMSLRLVEALRRSGASHVAVLGKPSLAGLALACGNVDEVRNLDVGHFHRLFGRDVRLPNDAADWLGRFDLAVNTLADRDQIVADNLRDLGIKSVINLDPRPRVDWAGHVSGQWLHDLASHELMADAGPPNLNLPEAIRHKAEDALRRLFPEEDLKPVVMHPGSGGRAKCWPIDQFIMLSAELKERRFAPLFVLGPVELERFTHAEVSAIRTTSPTIDSPSFLELAGLVAAGGRYVGNDSGVSHLAAAVGAKSVVLFGPTDPVRWRPLGDSVRVVRGARAGEMPGVAEVLREIIALVSSPS